MERYRKTVQTRRLLLMGLAVLAVAVSLYDVFFAGEGLQESFIFCFQTGIAISLGFMSVALIIRYNAILKNDEKLREQYNRETDERYKAIRAKAGMPMLLITSVGMIAAAIVAGHYNVTVFVTLVVAAVGQLLVGVVVKLIYLRKM